MKNCQTIAIFQSHTTVVYGTALYNHQTHGSCQSPAGERELGPAAVSTAQRHRRATGGADPWEVHQWPW